MDFSEPNASTSNPPYERPLECSECKKKVAVHYTEIVNGVITRTGMCADCPALHRRLKGISEASGERKIEEGTTDLVCGQCGTTLEMVRTGNPLGCGTCYEVFGDIILSEISAANKFPQQRATTGGRPLHVGRVPGETQQINPSLKLLALNEALNDTLLREDYEQAAWLRDQINALTENQKKSSTSEEKNGAEGSENDER